MWYNLDLYTYEPYSNRKNKRWFSRYNACFLKLAIVWHSMATLVGSDLSTSKFVSDQLEHSHGNLVFFFHAVKGVIQVIYSEIMKHSGPLSSRRLLSCSTVRGWRNSPSGNFIGHRTQSRNILLSLSCLSDIPTCISGVWPVTVLGCRIRFLAF